MQERHKRWALSTALTATVALPIALYFDMYGIWFNVLLAATLTVVASLGENYVMDRIEDSYMRRFNADEIINWDVLMNHVMIGKVSDIEYAAMQLHALHDVRNAVAQVLNLGRIILILFAIVLVTMPLLFFWGCFVFALFSPESLVATVHELQETDAFVMATMVRSFLEVGTVAAALIICFLMALGFRFGFKNHYKASVARMLRLHCNLPVDGDISLGRIVDGEVLFG